MTLVRILDKQQVLRLMPVADCIEPMAEVLAALTRGELENPLRTFLRPEGSGNYLGLMPAYRPDPPLFALKTACVAPANTARGLDTHQGFIALFDGVTGQTRALLNAAAITGIRTAAVSALATRLLARPDSKTLAILGAGTQARFHLEGMRAVLPFERVLVWNRTPGRGAELDGVEEVGTAREALAEADVVVTVTASAEPILAREWLKEGAHVKRGSAPRRQRHASSTPPRWRRLPSTSTAANRR